MCTIILQGNLKEREKIMKVLEDFLKKVTPNKRKSKLYKFKDAILELYDKDYSVEQIQTFLKKQKIETTKQNIYYFINRIKKKGVKKNFSLQTNKENDDGENKGIGDNNNTEVPNEEREEVTLTSMRRIMRERENNKEK